MFKKIVGIFILIIMFFVETNLATFVMHSTDLKMELPKVKININPCTIVYEGDIIECNITGNPLIKYWFINNQSFHTTFYGDNPIIFDPEPTPLDTNYVNLTVYVENNYGNASDTIQVIIKRIYFGDIHWHTFLSDGYYPLELMYNNAKKDNYLDFACPTDHTFNYFNRKFLIPYTWQRTKNLVNKHYIPGDFTTFLAYEYSSTQIRINNIDFPSWIDRGHINFYYKNVYQDALAYSRIKTYTFNNIFKSMSDEWDKGNKNICFFHHPLAGGLWPLNRSFSINWTNFLNKIEKREFRDVALKIFRGVEFYSRWGTAIGKYSNIPIHWNYSSVTIDDNQDCWVENALWEWSENIYTKNFPFILLASSDTHGLGRPGSARINIWKKNPSGIIAAYSIHNTRDEIWDSMNNCSIYGSQLLKIRANVRFNGQMVLGQWINCSSNLTIRITAQSTFPGNDCSGKNMCPDGYSSNELCYNISDIWLIKKDRQKGRPWCKIISHVIPNDNLAVFTFVDDDVHPNDFYFIVIRQKGQELQPKEDAYMAIIGPVFIKDVV